MPSERDATSQLEYDKIKVDFSQLTKKMFKNEPLSPLNDFIPDDYDEDWSSKYNPHFEKKFFQHYFNCKKLYLLYESKNSFVNRLATQCQYQINA